MADIVTCPNCGKRNRLPAAAAGVARCANCHTALPWLTTAGDGDFEEVVTTSTLPVLLDLWAPWCQPCRLMAPVLDELAGELAGRVRIAKLNVDDNPVTASRFSVRSIPTLLALKDGREVDRIVGVQPKAEIARRLERLLDTARTA
jgi:thioredoxin 2